MSILVENIITLAKYACCSICYLHTSECSILDYEVIPPEDYDDEDWCKCYWCKGWRNVFFFTYRKLVITKTD